MLGCKDSSTEADPCRSEIIPIPDGVSRKFKMGFTTWSYGPQASEVEDTYNFIFQNGDIYTEQIDDKIPWEAWLNNQALPQSFVNDINRKVTTKPAGKPLLVSASLFNTGRDELIEGFSGNPPTYDSLDQPTLVNAYWKHLNYLVNAFKPDYFILAMEVNDFYIKQPTKWKDYTELALAMKDSLKKHYPSLKVSASMTLHNFYKVNTSNVNTFLSDVATHINQFDFAAISFYPFFKDLHNQSEFQEAFDFLHSKITVPIAFVETAHLPEDLVIPNLSTNIKSNECEQKEYLQTLLLNAQNNDYAFIIWWAHRDYDALWETFPADAKDVGQIWKDTGLLNETGTPRPAWKCWETAFLK